MNNRNNKVICIDNTGYENDLELNKVYTIDFAGAIFVSLKNGGIYRGDRFAWYEGEVIE